MMGHVGCGCAEGEAHEIGHVMHDACGYNARSTLRVSHERIGRYFQRLSWYRTVRVCTFARDVVGCACKSIGSRGWEIGVADGAGVLSQSVICAGDAVSIIIALVL